MTSAEIATALAVIREARERLYAEHPSLAARKMIRGLTGALGIAEMHLAELGLAEAAVEATRETLGDEAAADVEARQRATGLRS
jgi:hypothetical protein